MDFILPFSQAETLLREEIKNIKECGYFDYKSKKPSFSISDYLENKGIMLGLLIARTKTEERVVLKAFSGALSSSYIVEGFTPPCFQDR